MLAAAAREIAPRDRSLVVLVVYSLSALTAGAQSMPLAASRAPQLLSAGEPCGNTYSLNIDYSQCSASSIHGGTTIGQSYGKGKLGSNSAWLAAQNLPGEWWQFDLGAVEMVAGVMTQPGTKSYDTGTTTISREKTLSLTAVPNRLWSSIHDEGWDI